MLTIPPSTATPDASGPPVEVRPPDSLPVEAPPARSLWTILRTGVIASAACHAVLILWAVGIFDSAKPLAAAPPQSISVDLVPDKDAPPPAPAKPLGMPPPDTPRPLAPVAQTRPPAALPDAVVPQESAAPPPPNAEQQVALAARLADTLQLPVDLPGIGDGDTRAAETQVKIGRTMIADFKAHLNKCWSAPAGSAAEPKLKVLIRVVFKRNGQFFREPMLIQAIASPAGPALVKSAMQALQQCQPYDFMPADKYDEWKVLDLAFSPQGIL